MEPILDFERAIMARNPTWSCKDEWASLAQRILQKLFKLWPGFRALWHAFAVPDEYFVVVLGIGNIAKTYPYFLYQARKKIVYFIDAWEPVFNRAEAFLNDTGVDVAFFSSKQAAGHFSKKLDRTKCYWVPEGIAMDRYCSKKKDIDVLQLGRKYDLYHEKILDYLVRRNITYLFEKRKGKVVFETNEDFVDGLARTKISICFPSNITHPERSGFVSVLTHRYLQSMASKCLIVGAMPEDMKELFDYMPIIEADMNRPGEQLEEILKNFEQYIPLIEKNYSELRTKHLWEHRVDRINAILAA